MLLRVLVSILLFHSASSAQANKDCAQTIREPLIIYDVKNNYRFKGFTPHGLKVFKKARDAMRQRQKVFQGRLLDLEGVFHVLHGARLAKKSLALFGPPGGAKTALAQFMIDGEREPAFKLQMHPMMTEQAIIGGQDFEQAKLGRFVINTQGSLLAHQVALIDEIEKANPAALNSLLSILQEGEVLAGGQVHKARTETIITTSNASLSEWQQIFIDNGQGTTAAALANRFPFKVVIPNWLSDKNRAQLQKVINRRKHLEAVSKTHSEVLSDEVFLKPEFVDWEDLREITEVFFTFNELFDSTFIELSDKAKKATDEAVNASEEAKRTNPQDNPFVLLPSGDLTTRLGGQSPDIIKKSAMISFLLSPLSDDFIIDKRNKPIELDPLSLWRFSSLMSATGSGQTEFVIDDILPDKFDIRYGDSFVKVKYRDSGEQRLYAHLQAEQQRYKELYLEQIKKLQLHIKIRAQYTSRGKSKFDGDDLDKTSFEVLLKLYNRGD